MTTIILDGIAPSDLSDGMWRDLMRVIGPYRDMDLTCRVCDKKQPARVWLTPQTDGRYLVEPIGDGSTAGWVLEEIDDVRCPDHRATS